MAATESSIQDFALIFGYPGSTLQSSIPPSPAQIEPFHSDPALVLRALSVLVTTLGRLHPYRYRNFLRVDPYIRCCFGSNGLRQARPEQACYVWGTRYIGFIRIYLVIIGMPFE